MIEIIDIYKSFGSVDVLKGVSITIAEGEIISIVGASGAGKTTLLHIMGTLERPDKGTIKFDGKNIFDMNDAVLSSFRNKEIGFVFQFHHLLPEFTALENIMLPSFIAGLNKKEAEKKALELINFMGLSERAEHKPTQLSGGEQQRVAVARALINSPRIVLADEPSGNLDSKNTEEIYQLFRKLQQEFNQTFVIITHNYNLASIADKKSEMKDGKIYPISL